MKAYEIALKKYHGWMLQKLFTVSVPSLSKHPTIIPKAVLVH